MPFIKVEGLTKSFGAHRVIDRFSLDVHPGEVVLFQGPSGVGKSTLLRCLTYLEPFEEGSVTVGDLKITAGMDERHHRAALRGLHQRLGFVFQFFNLFPHKTVLENITLGPVKALGVPAEKAREEAMVLLKRVGLEEKAGAYPARLSGGQQQRVGIARALALRPKAVLLDEPTSSLDPEMKHEIIEVIEELSRDMTLLIVTHEPVFAERIATRLVKLGPGCSILSDVKK